MDDSLYEKSIYISDKELTSTLHNLERLSLDSNIEPEMQKQKTKKPGPVTKDILCMNTKRTGLSNKRQGIKRRVVEEDHKNFLCQPEDSTSNSRCKKYMQGLILHEYDLKCGKL